jgi:hypothetical protein
MQFLEVSFVDFVAEQYVGILAVDRKPPKNKLVLEADLMTLSS